MEKTIFLTTGGVFALLIGHIDTFVVLLIIVLSLNQITGILRAFYEKSSYQVLQGLIRALATMMVVMIANICDILLGANDILRDFVIGFMIANASVSVLDNANIIGVPIPKKLIRVLDALKGKDEVREEKIDEGDDKNE